MEAPLHRPDRLNHQPLAINLTSIPLINAGMAERGLLGATKVAPPHPLPIAEKFREF